jgi:hypothetical protein
MNPTPLGYALCVVAAFWVAFGVVAMFWFVAEAIVGAYKGRQR